MNVNAGAAIPPDQLGRAISEVLLEWADGQEKEFFKAIDTAADACNETIKQHTPYKTGNYRRHFAVERQRTTRHQYSAEWYVEAPEYRLTHLLENGHLTRNGTKRTKAIKHIKYGRQIAEQVLDEKLAGLWGG